VNIYSEELEVYELSFKKSLFTLIEAKENFLDEGIRSAMNFYSIEIPELNTSVNIS
jgi:hypothetical protein